MPQDLRHAIAGSVIPVEAIATKVAVCNRLALEPGAFARQRALDAIDWRPWSGQVLAEARERRRPLLVFSGYSSCARCEELLRAALSQPAFARTVNREFIPVLLDREERPDVDAYVMQAVQVLTGGGGWPAVAFLDGDTRPFAAYSWGAAAAGEASLALVVGQVSRRIELAAGMLEERAEATVEKMLLRATLDTSGPLPDAAGCARGLSRDLARSFDPDSGSFGPPPLFPKAPTLDFLLNLEGDPKALEMATTSLAGLQASPLADPVGGGFHRYARQAGWREPAWEKMLAENAALAGVYLKAAARTGRTDFADTARQAVEFLIRDLRLASGAFAASIGAVSLDAQGNPCDGCYYAESEEVRSAALDSPPARERALAERMRRPAPLRDDRILADANGLAVSTLVRAASVLSQPRYLEAANATAKFLDEELRSGGRVLHCAYPDGRRCGDGYLADQAMVALAFLDLGEAKAGSAASHWLEAARAIADAMPARFGHAATGGFFMTGDDAPPLRLRYESAHDGATASGNAAAAMLYVRLAARTGEPRYAELARGTFEAFSEVLALRPPTAPAMVSALVEWGASSK